MPSAGEDGGLSKFGLAFLGGLQLRMAEIALAGSTTPNAYKRRRPYTFCPVNTCWGRDNRTVGLRIIDSSHTATRVEKRDGSADCNPYYLIATDLAAGLDGMESEAEPKHFIDGDAYQCEDADPLPADIDAALSLAEKSEFLRSVLGEWRLEILAGQAKRERDLLADHVTSLETGRYLRNF